MKRWDEIFNQYYNVYTLRRGRIRNGYCASNARDRFKPAGSMAYVCSKFRHERRYPLRPRWQWSWVT